MTALSKKTFLIVFLFLAGFLAFPSVSAYDSPESEEAFYRMNDSSSPLLDYSNNGRDASEGGSPNYQVSGIQRNQGEWDTGHAIEFTGFDYFSTSITDFDKFTFSAWVEVQDTISNNAIMSLYESDGTRSTLAVDNEGPVIGFWDGTWRHREPYSGELVHVAVTVNGSNGMKMFVDGSQVGSTTSTNIRNYQSLYIGQNGQDGEYTDGMIDEARVFSKVLSSSEISNLYNYNQITDPTSGTTLSNPSPTDGSTAVAIDTDLSIEYSDSEGDSGTVTFYWANGTQIYQETGVASGSTVSTVSLNVEPSTTYEWYVEADDGSDTSTAGNYSFTTEIDESSYSVKKVSVNSSFTGSDLGKAQAVYLSCGDDSVTGNGDIVIDCSSVPSKDYVAFRDMNDDPLPYEFETFDSSSGGVAYVYNNWTGDGSQQMQVLYGANFTDSEDTAFTWKNAVMSHNMEDAQDSSGNSIDGSVGGASQVSGMFGDAYSFSSDSDYFDLDSTSKLSGGSEMTFSAWVNQDTIDSSNYEMVLRNYAPTGVWYFANGPEGDYRFVVRDTNGDASNTARVSSFTPSTGEWYQVAFSLSSNNVSF